MFKGSVLKTTNTCGLLKIINYTGRVSFLFFFFLEKVSNDTRNVDILTQFALKIKSFVVKTRMQSFRLVFEMKSARIFCIPQV